MPKAIIRRKVRQVPTLFGLRRGLTRCLPNQTPMGPCGCCCCGPGVCPCSRSSYCFIITGITDYLCEDCYTAFENVPKTVYLNTNCVWQATDETLNCTFGELTKQWVFMYRGDMIWDLVWGDEVAYRYVGPWNCLACITMTLITADTGTNDACLWPPSIMLCSACPSSSSSASGSSTSLRVCCPGLPEIIYAHFCDCCWAGTTFALTWDGSGWSIDVDTCSDASSSSSGSPSSSASPSSSSSSSSSGGD